MVKRRSAHLGVKRFGQRMLLAVSNGTAEIAVALEMPEASALREEIWDIQVEAYTERVMEGRKRAKQTDVQIRPETTGEDS